MKSFFGETIRRKYERLTSSSRKPVGPKGRTQTLECLDPRMMMAGDFYESMDAGSSNFGIISSPESAWAGSIEYTATSNTLTLTGGEYDDDATVEIQGSKLLATITSTAFGVSKTKTFSLSPVSLVSLISFTGGDGNDSFENLTSISSEASGGDGDDILLGGSGDDVFEGGQGRDTLRGRDGNDVLHGGYGRDSLYGGKGDDSLYGDGDNDILFGYTGNDGLYGGGGVDVLTGGAGSDRFLYGRSDDDLVDVDSEDAKIEFEDGGVNWTETEIEAVDEALRTLHHATGDKTLLERTSGKMLTFVREQAEELDSAESDKVTLGINYNNGKIVLNDSAFTSVTPLSQVVYHEIGHNWDDEGAIWSDFKDESGWDRIGWFESQDDHQSLSGDENWYYDSDAQFVMEYGRNSPYEDLATVFELYFTHVDGNQFHNDVALVDTSTVIGQLGAKWDLVSNYLESL